MERRKTEQQDADSLLRRGRPHGCFAITRASRRSWVVLEPAHAEKQQAREPGDLWSASARKGARPVCEGAKPQGRHARSRGVGPRHSIDEPDEQRRAIFGGAWGEKGAGQGEHRFIQHSPDTARGNRVCQGWSGGRGGTLLFIHPRWEPYAGKPLVRFCAGGDQRWSSLPQHLSPMPRKTSSQAGSVNTSGPPILNPRGSRFDYHRGATNRELKGRSRQR